MPKNFTLEKAIQNYLNAIRKGMFKVFSKMGIATIQSYRGAQVFEAIGIEEDLVEKHFPEHHPESVGLVYMRLLRKPY